MRISSSGEDKSTQRKAEFKCPSGAGQTGFWELFFNCVVWSYQVSRRSLSNCPVAQFPTSGGSAEVQRCSQHSGELQGHL